MDGVMPDFVKNARATSEQRSGVAADFASGSSTISDQLKKVVQEALDYNKDVIDMRSSSLADYLAAPAQGESRFGVETFTGGEQAGQANPNFIFNPFERNATIANYVRDQQIPFLTANTLLGFREGQTADIINAGTNAYNAQATAADKSATAARQAYVDALNEFKTGEDIRLENAKLKQSGGDNTAIAALLKYLETLGGGGMNDSGLTLDDIIEEDMPTNVPPAMVENPNYNWQNAIFGTQKYVPDPAISAKLNTLDPNITERMKTLKALDFGSRSGEQSAQIRR